VEFVDVYCVNRDMDRTDFILKKDAHSYHMMNVIDYLIGNTDRHWGNWGFWVDNKTNKVLKLHPLMDYNKAFLSYDKISGARRCLKQDLSLRREQALALRYTFIITQTPRMLFSIRGILWDQAYWKTGISHIRFVFFYR
jgi:hypothetical protein